MTGAPPPYPRTPHLWPLAGEQTRSVLPAAEAERWLREPIIVEEKLDGANVSLWCDAGTVRAASRAGSEAMDRARQLGRLRAWSFAKFEPLQTLLADDWVLYGEWMWLRHGVAYDRLPDWLLALDCGIRREDSRPSTSETRAVSVRVLPSPLACSPESSAQRTG